MGRKFSNLLNTGLILCFFIFVSLFQSYAISQGSSPALPDPMTSDLDINVTTKTPKAGEEATIDVNVWNLGIIDVKDVEVHFYEEDNLIGAERIDVPVTRQWEKTTIDSSGDVGWSTSIGLDSKHGVHIIFRDNTNSLLKYAYRSSGGNWETFIIDDTTEIGFSTSLAIDINDGIHISYIDRTNAVLKYAYRSNGGNWVYENATGDQANNSISIAIDNDFGVHISYGRSSDATLKYAYKPKGGTWSNQSIDSETFTGGENSIAIDNMDGVHVSYWNMDEYELKYAYKPKGGTWSTSIIDSDGNVGQDPSIGVDSQGGVHVAYEDLTNWDLKYAYKPKGGSWISYPLDSEGSQGVTPSLYVDDHDGVHIAYGDNSNVTLKYTFKPKGGEWTINTIDSDGRVGYFISMEVDEENRVHISYYDYLKKDLKYSKGTIEHGMTKCSIKWTPTIAGPRNITVRLDENNTMEESDETNNEGTIMMDVLPSDLALIEISPHSVMVAAGDVQQFNATCYDIFGNLLDIEPVWEANGGGNLDQAGEYSAKFAGSWYIYANRSGVSGSATINVTAGPLAIIELSPSEATLNIEDTLQFTTKGYDEFNNVVPFIAIWDLNGGGSIDQNGAFKAQDGGVWMVYSNFSNLSDNATVTILFPDTDGDGQRDDIDPDDDGDGFTDVDEIHAGTDPLDPDSIPKKPISITTETQLWFLLPFIIIIMIVVIVILNSRRK